jgi:signal peptidase
MRTRAVHRVAVHIVDVAAVLGLLCVIALVAALVSGVRPVVLRTGSMSPSMPAGTLVLTVPAQGPDLRVGDVVTVPTRTAVLVTHRVVEMDRDDGRWTATLQGDANEAPDAETYDVTDGARRVVAVVPGLGPVVTAMRGPEVLAGALALIGIALLPGRRAHPSDLGPGTPGSVAADGGDPASPPICL